MYVLFIHGPYNIANEGKTFARKVIRVLGAVTTDDVENEIRALKKLCQNRHPNIVQVSEYGELNPDSAIYFIDMELCDISLGNYLLGQELKDVVGWATVREEDEVPTHAYNILQQILNGLVFIHCLGEVHRDLSPQNGTDRSFFCYLQLVLFRNGYWKIADFGLTSEATSNRLISTSAARGKPCYRSPELLRGPESGYNNKADMWSFGCIAYELFTGKKAFWNDHEAWQYGVNNRSPKMYFKGLDDLTKHYIHGLLEAEPEKRPSARALLKERFLTETPIAVSSEEARAHKRRRTAFTNGVSQSATSSLLYKSLRWAVSERQLDLILALTEVGIKFDRSLDALALFEAFQHGSKCSSGPKMEDLISSSYPAWFWLKHIPGLLTELGNQQATATNSEFSNLLETSWHTVPRSSIDGTDWSAIWLTGCFSVSHLHEWHLQHRLGFRSDAIQFSGDGAFLATICDSQLRLYQFNVDFAGTGPTLLINVGGISCARFTHDCSRLVIATIFGAFYVWGMKEKRTILTLEPTSRISEIDVSQDDTRVIAAPGIGEAHPKLILCSLDTGNIICESLLPTNLRGGGSVTISPNGKYAVATGAAFSDARVVVWNFSEETRLLQFHGHIRYLLSFSHHSGPPKCLAQRMDSTLASWTLPLTDSGIDFDISAFTRGSFLQTKTIVSPRRYNINISTPVCFSPDDVWVVGGAMDGSVRFWRYEDGVVGLLLQGPPVAGSLYVNLC